MNTNNSFLVKLNLHGLSSCSKLIKALTLLALVLFSFSSCTKKNRSGSVVFWYTQSTASALVNSDASSLIIYVDGQLVGTYSTSLFASKIPGCGSQGSVSVIKDLGSSKSKSFTFVAKDEDGYIWWDGSVKIEDNTCTNYELSF